MSSTTTQPAEGLEGTAAAPGRARRAGDRVHPSSLARAARARRLKRVAKKHGGKAAAHGPISSISPNGIAFIASFEGFSSKPYWDRLGGLWTIGFGETHGVSQHTPPVSRQQAIAKLRHRVDNDYLAPVMHTARSVGLKLNQNEADALASLVYNCGPGVCDAGHTMGNALRSKNKHAIADAFLVYDKSGKPPAVVAGLARRRRDERAMFLRARA